MKKQVASIGLVSLLVNLEEYRVLWRLNVGEFGELVVKAKDERLLR